MIQGAKKDATKSFYQEMTSRYKSNAKLYKKQMSPRGDIEQSQNHVIEEWFPVLKTQIEYSNIH